MFKECLLNWLNDISKVTCEWIQSKNNFALITDSSNNQIRKLVISTAQVSTIMGNIGNVYCKSIFFKF